MASLISLVHRQVITCGIRELVAVAVVKDMAAAAEEVPTSEVDDALIAKRKVISNLTAYENAPVASRPVVNYPKIVQ